MSSSLSAKAKSSFSSSLGDGLCPPAIPTMPLLSPFPSPPPKAITAPEEVCPRANTVADKMAAPVWYFRPSSPSDRFPGFAEQGGEGVGKQGRVDGCYRLSGGGSQPARSECSRAPRQEKAAWRWPQRLGQSLGGGPLYTR